MFGSIFSLEWVFSAFPISIRKSYGNRESREYPFLGKCSTKHYILIEPSFCTKPHFFKNCVPLLHETTLFREMCAPLARNHTFLQKHRNPHAWIREQLSKSAHLPDPTHARTKYPVRGNPSLRYRAFCEMFSVCLYCCAT